MTSRPVSTKTLRTEQTDGPVCSFRNNCPKIFDMLVTTLAAPNNTGHNNASHAVDTPRSSSSSCVHTAHFTAPNSGPARVLHQIRTTPGITRARLHEELNLSQPTVTRHVATLIERGLVEQTSPPQSPTTAIGRPGTTLVPAGHHLTALGAHVGVHSTQLIAVDGQGRPLQSRTLALPLPELQPEEALEAIFHGLTSLGRNLPQPVGLGFAFSSPLDAAGRITSDAYGWDAVDTTEILNHLAATNANTTVPISLATGVGAMAGAELSSTPLRGLAASNVGTESTLYIYARELVAHAWIVGDAVHQPFTGVPPAAFTQIAESGSFRRSRGGSGHPLGTTAVLEAAQRKGLGVSSIAELVAISQHNPVARKLLDERADLLGRIVALAVEIVDPATVVFAGDAFTSDPGAVKTIAAHLMTDAPRRRLSIQRAGDGILSRAAAVTALHRLWADPLGAPGVGVPFTDNL